MTLRGKAKGAVSGYRRGALPDGREPPWAISGQFAGRHQNSRRAVIRVVVLVWPTNPIVQLWAASGGRKLHNRGEGLQSVAVIAGPMQPPSGLASSAVGASRGSSPSPPSWGRSLRQLTPLPAAAAGQKASGSG